MIITISRQAYSNGSLIGRLVAEQLGLHVYDRTIVEEVARRLAVDPDVVTRIDESVLTPMESVLMEWRSNVNEQTYQRSLREALQQIVDRGQAVIIGRGANYVVSGPDVTHVRIIAPMDLRLSIYRATHDVSEHEAERAIRREDEKRARFVSTHFRRDVDDASGYDLVVNLVNFTPEMAATTIARVAQLREEQARTRRKTTLPEHIALMTRHRKPVRPEIVERWRAA